MLLHNYHYMVFGHGAMAISMDFWTCTMVMPWCSSRCREIQCKYNSNQLEITLYFLLVPIIIPSVRSGPCRRLRCLQGSQGLSESASLSEVTLIICRDRCAHQNRRSAGEPARETDRFPKRHDSRHRTEQSQWGLQAARERYDAPLSRYESLCWGSVTVSSFITTYSKIISRH